MLVVAHIGHWALNLLYAAPMAVIGGVLWWTSRKERLAGGPPEEEYWEGQDDPQWNGEPAAEKRASTERGDDAQHGQSGDDW